MMRKFAKINATVQLLVEIFADSGRWTHWMPGVRHAVLVRSSDGLSIVDLDVHDMGRSFKQRVECRVTGSSVRIRQISGFLKKWQSTWSFGPAPGNSGTTATCELDVDLGMMSLVVPARLVQNQIDRVFDETVAGARREVQARASARSAAGEEAGETVLEVFETRTGFEVRVGGRRFELGKTP